MGGTRRKLASVQYIHSVSPIEGADRIEAVGVLGWQCVVKKGEFSVGDLCVYFEIDSFLPLDPAFEFLRNSCYRNSELLGEGFRLRTQRFRGQLSQGLVLPLSILPAGDYDIGQDVTKILGVGKWEIEERATSSGTIIGPLPAGVTKTEEVRIQSEPGLLEEFRDLPYAVTTKMDGTSMTVAVIDGRTRVCGHNYEYADDGACSMWDYVHAHHIGERLLAAGIDDMVLQGEFCAAGIQRNPLRLKVPNWYVFTAYDLQSHKRLGVYETFDFCREFMLDMVPIEESGTAFAYRSVDELLERARGSYDSGVTKEGIVIRPLEPVYSSFLSAPLSVKVINNDYLIKKK